MKKSLLLVLVALAAVVWGASTYPAIGQVALKYGGQLEARVHGFSKKTVQVGEAPIRLYEGGDKTKPTLVLVHGYSADKEVWPRFASHFVHDFHVVIPDMAGHGETGFNPQWNYSITAQAERVLGLMDAMQVKQFHVAGNSMGGHITAMVALMAPQRVLSAIPIDPAGVVPPSPSKMDLMVDQGHNPFEVQGSEAFKQFYAMTMAKPPYLPQFILDGMAKHYQERRPELQVIFDQISRKDRIDSRLNEIKVPMLLIWGRQDQLIDVSSVQVWQKGVPNLKVHVFDDLGHMPMVEDPKASAEVVKTFIKGLNGTVVGTM